METRYLQDWVYRKCVDAGSTVRALVSASNGSASTTAASPAVAASKAALAEVSGPSISGEVALGRALSAEPGIWTGKGDIVYAYQWQRCNEAGASCSNISDAIGASYQPVAADVGHTLKVAVTAKDGSETTSASSPATTVLAALTTAPEDVLEPSIEGYPVKGDTLSAVVGVWVGAEPISYRYQWQRCDSSGDSCTGITGATAETYTLAEADLASTIRVELP
jgi:hypothetical protein